MSQRLHICAACCNETFYLTVYSPLRIVCTFMRNLSDLTKYNIAGLNLLGGIETKGATQARWEPYLYER